MKNKTQKERVAERLLKYGYVTRNQCLQNYISRLGAIICDLEAEGWSFEAKYLTDKDYIYKVISCPFRRVEYKLPNGETVTTWKKEH